MLFWVEGLPTAAVTDLGATPNGEDQADRPRRSGRDEREIRQPVHHRHHSGEDLSGQDKDNTVTVVQNILVANAKMADRLPTTSSRRS